MNESIGNVIVLVGIVLDAVAALESVDGGVGSGRGAIEFALHECTQPLN